MTLILQVDSHEKALARGRQELVFLTGQLDIARELDVVEPAHRLYNLALLAVLPGQCVCAGHQAA